ncbi:diguanylate cyclase/phosphodiesterase (GGDEF & EAL domains) with PAS/PAC sensor [Hydrogenimonas sp.]|nr:diguanylate cyclase/phosphodiesterase (GGDEF & EAL domains) with PAS/PAC sensor [Hydrogenimonas sp.]
MIKHISLRFLIIFIAFVVAGLFSVNSLSRSMDLNREVERFNREILENIDSLSLLLAKLHNEALLSLPPYQKKVRPISQNGKNLISAETFFNALEHFSFSGSKHQNLLKHLHTLKMDWKGYLDIRKVLLKSLKSGKEESLKRVLPPYMIAYGNLSHNISDLKHHYIREFGRYVEDLRDQAMNSFYIGLVIAVSTLILLFFLLMEVNTINRKLQSYLEEKELFQKKLANANKALTQYSEALEDEVKKRTDEALEHLMKNPLTKLHNRLSFVKRLEKNSRASVAIFNIDRFQSYNDLFGAKVGDRIIQEYAAYLRQTIPYLYEIYHLQGDEFAIIEPDKKASSTFLAMVKRVAELAREFHYTDENGSFILQASIGVCIDEEQPLTKADMALKKAKNSSESLVVYSENIIKKQRYLENITMTKVLSKAIKDDRIVPYYQPIFDARTGKVFKYEVLARLVDENGLVIPPAHFITLAKQIKLYSELTKIIFDKAMESIEEHGLHLSINLSADDIHHRPTRDYIMDRIAMSAFSNHVTFELLESEETTNYDDLSAFIQRVKQYGVKIAIDDFGSGYSNFAKILKLKVDYIKIDGSFIKKIDTDADSKEFAEIIHKLANSYNMKTVAEFVADESIYNTVREIGIDFVQGYHFGKPIPLSEIVKPDEIAEAERPDNSETERRNEVSDMVWD